MVEAAARRARGRRAGQLAVVVADVAGDTRREVERGGGQKKLGAEAHEPGAAMDVGQKQPRVQPVTVQSTHDPP